MWILGISIIYAFTHPKKPNKAWVYAMHKRILFVIAGGHNNPVAFIYIFTNNAYAHFIPCPFSLCLWYSQDLPTLYGDGF
jgi:hypothetical protein